MGKRVATVLLSCLILSLLVYLFYHKVWLKKDSGIPAALQVRSLSAKALNVSLNGAYGETPFRTDTLTEGEKTLILSDGKDSFRTKISLLTGTMTVVNWGLGPSEAFSEGEILWLERAKGKAPFLVISNPDKAKVRLDGVLLGTTPLSSSEIAAGDHTLKLAKEGYKPREISIHLEEGYKLNIKAQLFLKPVEEKEVKPLLLAEEPRISLFDFSSLKEELLADPSNWARGIVYYLGYEGREAEGALLKTYDYFVDFRGQLYNGEGIKMAPGSEGMEEAEEIVVGYLGRTGEGLAEEAKSALLSLGETAFVKMEEVKILPTGLGWLRVRDEPSLSGKEIAKVNVGEQLRLLGESNNWYKVKLSDGGEGWLSAQYAKKL